MNNAPLVGYVGEGQPIPVRRFTTEAPTLKPHKLAAIIAFTRETARATGFEAICRQVLAENVGVGLDAALLSAAAETTASPAGLRAGATSVTPTAGGGESALSADVLKLAGAVTDVAGPNIVFVASPSEWIKITLRPRECPFPVLPSAALPTGTLMAVATNALAVAFDPVPEFEVASEGLLHMNDAPAQIGTETGVAAPSQSLFQTDSLGLRLILGASWALRAPAAVSVAVVEGVTW